MISIIIVANLSTGIQSITGRLAGRRFSDFEVLIIDGSHSCDGQAGSLNVVEPAICPTRKMLTGTPDCLFALSKIRSEIIFDFP